MSKVHSYFDTKTKARHRMRRQETRSKQLSRFRKHRNNVYRWFKSGYYPTPKDQDVWYEDDDECIYNGRGYMKKYGCTSVLKVVKKTTTRAIRRNTVFDEESYMLPTRNAYRKIIPLNDWLY